jgi:SpoVK/Ycf46/Vps4 family AAA+-type ATPase
MCAHAVADELSKQISIKTGKKIEFELLALNYSEIESKYVGEAPKNLESVFNYVRGKNIVLFFDEADSFLGKRITNVTQGAEQAINSLRSTMLIQLEKYEGIVIFATNLSHNYDSAFKTRFLEEILFDLPTKETRAEIFKNHIPAKIKELHLEKFLEDIDYLDFANQTDGLSGRDIKNIVWKTLAAGASKNGAEYQFTKNDFEGTIEDYKKEKEEEKKNNGIILDPKNVTAKVTPDCEKMKEKISESLTKE